jgi:hypothetical protein
MLTAEPAGKRSLGVRIILKLVLDKEDLRDLTLFKWFRIGKIGGIL